MLQKCQCEIFSFNFSKDMKEIHLCQYCFWVNLGCWSLLHLSRSFFFSSETCSSAHWKKLQSFRSRQAEQAKNLLKSPWWHFSKSNVGPRKNNIDSLTPGRCDSYSKSVISKHMLPFMFMSTLCEIALRWASQNTFHDKSTLIQAMAWWRQAPSY